MKFQKINILFETTFWNKLLYQKINFYKLSEKIHKITGFLNNNSIILNENSFENKENLKYTKINGYIQITNTIKNFKEINKNNLISNIAKKIVNKKNSEIITFILLVYIDVKKQSFLYWNGIPTFKNKVNYELIDNNINLSFNLNNILNIYQKSKNIIIPFNIDNLKKQNILILSKYEINNQVLKNLSFLMFKYKINLLDILFINNSKKIIRLKIPDITKDIVVYGWNKNRNKFIPKYYKLESQEDISNLNLKLMLWRMLNNININKLKSQKCLLIGAGTLGCNVARSLISWGIENITFIDSGTVSSTNPLRQSLYTFKDIGKNKAIVASKKLKEISPNINSIGYNINVPMPGHLSDNNTFSIIETIEFLVKNHDVIYILTDSRESRWLPILLSKIYNKILINVALGFNTFVIGRINNSLGCYFCNDVVVPRNSSINKTLDQQCSITRPAVSNIASSLSVELLIALLHSKDLIETKPDDYKQNINNSELGLIPHQIRGNISNMKFQLPISKPYEYCSCCSVKIINEYKKNKQNFLIKVLNNPEYLEEISGLNKLYNDTNNINYDF